MPLDEYIRKRKFNRTPEPASSEKLKGESSKLIFVVQKHAATRLHYDFRLEMDGVLKSWAVPKGPSMDPKDKRLAIQTEDHPYDYKDFHGVIPKGNYGAGTVEIWDEGWYELLERKEDSLKFVLHGKKLKGMFALFKMNNDEENQWLLVKKKDGIQAPRAEMFKNVKPMLAVLVDEPFDNKDWIFEIKWDGYRAISEISKYGVNMYSRNLLSFNELFEPIVQSLGKLNHEAVLDGEAVVLDKDGKAKFQLMQNYKRTRSGNLVYYVFDILFLDGHDLTSLPLLDRKNILRELVRNIGNVRYSEHIEKDGVKFYEVAKKQGLEGIIAKDKNSPYRIGKRSKEWLKIKTVFNQEAVICGYTEGRGGRKHFGALVLGVYEDKKLRYIGHTGGGFNEQLLKDTISKLHKLKTDKSPVDPPPKTNMPVTWVKPKLVCQVKFSEWTDEGLMRQPIFLGLREDKKPEEVGEEAPSALRSLRQFENSSEVKLTNLNKIYFPEDKLTKGDVINYYKKISGFLLPYIKDRPQNLLRHPDGIHGEKFYNKNIEDPPDFIKTVSIHHETEDRDVNYMVGGGLDSLLYMVNLGAIEINPWLSRVENLNKPDFMVLDLDPEGIDFKYVVQTALTVQSLLSEIDVPGFVKTSGKSGMHVMIPLGGKYSYEQVKSFGEILARIVNKKIPDITSVARSPSRRQKKVYIDFLQNRYGQTITAPYSLRPVKGANVSTPLLWDEVNEDLNPSDFNIRTIFKRLEKYGDIFKPILTCKTDLLSAINKLKL